MMKTRTTLLGSAMLAATLVLGTTAPGFTEGTPQSSTSATMKKAEDADQAKPKAAGSQQHKASKATTTGSGANSKQLNTTTGTKKVDDPDQDKGSGAQNSNAGRSGNMR
jgi:hypothetical protein